MYYNPLYDNDYNNGVYDSPDVDMMDYSTNSEYKQYEEQMTDDDLYNGY